MAAIDVLEEVTRTLNEVLSHGSDPKIFNLQTPLLGSIPELDSMAVVTLLGELEERFGIVFDDDELDGSIFANVGSLVAFVSAKLPQ